MIFSRKSKHFLKIAVLLLVIIVAYRIWDSYYFKEGFTTPDSCTYFYMEECGHCKRFAPEWDKFVSTYKGPVKMNKIERANAGPLLKKYNINGFPKVIIVDKEGDFREYNGARTSDSLHAYFSN